MSGNRFSAFDFPIFSVADYFYIPWYEKMLKCASMSLESLKRDPEGDTSNLKILARSVIPPPVWSTGRHMRNALLDLQLILEARGQFPFIKDITIDNQTFRIVVTGTELRRRLFNLGNEQQHQRHILAVIQSKSIYMDIGADIGLHALPMSLKAHHVYAIEPDPDICSVLRQNLAINNRKNTTVLPIALWNHNEPVDLQTNGLAGNAPIVTLPGKQDIYSFQKRISVAGVRLDTLIQDGLVEQPDVIKIDVEGAELQVLDGMGTSIRPSHIFIEIHGLPFSNNPERVHDTLTHEMGYHLEYAWKRGGETLCHYLFDST